MSSMRWILNKQKWLLQAQTETFSTEKKKKKKEKVIQRVVEHYRIIYILLFYLFVMYDSIVITYYEI